MNSSEIQDWKHAESYDEDELEVTKMHKDISKLTEVYNVYSRTLLNEHLIEGKSFSEIARDYKINRRYISETITPCKKEIIIKLKELWNK